MEIGGVLSAITESKSELYAVIVSVTYIVHLLIPKKKPCKVCMKGVLLAQMKVYRDKIEPIKSLAKAAYAKDLIDYLADNDLHLPSKEIADLLIGHREKITCAFREAEIYTQQTLIENHIPAIDTAEFFSYCKEKFEAHQNKIWTYYQENYTSKYLLPFEGREKRFNEQHDNLFDKWLEMFRVFKKISTGEYKSGGTV